MFSLFDSVYNLHPFDNVVKCQVQEEDDHFSFFVVRSNPVFYNLFQFDNYYVSIRISYVFSNMYVRFHPNNTPGFNVDLLP
jgi:hypothetical protein